MKIIKIGIASQKDIRARVLAIAKALKVQLPVRCWIELLGEPVNQIVNPIVIVWLVSGHCY